MKYAIGPFRDYTIEPDKIASLEDTDLRYFDVGSGVPEAPPNRRLTASHQVGRHRHENRETAG